MYLLIMVVKKPTFLQVLEGQLELEAVNPCDQMDCMCSCLGWGVCQWVKKQGAAVRQETTASGQETNSDSDSDPSSDSTSPEAEPACGQATAPAAGTDTYTIPTLTHIICVQTAMIYLQIFNCCTHHNKEYLEKEKRGFKLEKQTSCRDSNLFEKFDQLLGNLFQTCLNLLGTLIL